jgi:hypothetical protein
MTRNSDLVTAVEDSLKAPSVHNTQPWHWRLGRDHVELHADRGRQLTATDPEGRDLVLSCGAALHHLRVALAARGLGCTVTYLPGTYRPGTYRPGPENGDLLATVTLTAGPPDPVAAALYGQIGRRHTDRRRLSHRPVPAEVLAELAEQARHAGAELVPVTDSATRERLVSAFREAAARQRFAPGYEAELQLWTRRTTGARDGIGPGNIPTPLEAGLPLRTFGEHGQLTQPHPASGPDTADTPDTDAVDAAELMVIVSEGDGTADRLRAGEALSAVLLHATRLRLATTPLSQATEVAQARAAISRALQTARQPQILVRVGWLGASAGDLPATPRRDLWSVLLPS